ncbi:hypothetical protein P691DRAFT_788684 [Macrolepiota fuliginosa MF-IS2]|uniref:Uncharacterized protein n=1 Tax=Macrolepiota fuliginosa MF-IS2 TaxID=1400762 RepID=A0A9P5X484_9AGAR|nr:hypothetical protein P691DRAFT_788684 [Macrolepiota fuliginosa MF-IS2]
MEELAKAGLPPRVFRNTPIERSTKIQMDLGPSFAAFTAAVDTYQAALKQNCDNCWINVIGFRKLNIHIFVLVHQLFQALNGSAGYSMSNGTQATARGIFRDGQVVNSQGELSHDHGFKVTWKAVLEKSLTAWMDMAPSHPITMFVGGRKSCACFQFNVPDELWVLILPALVAALWIILPTTIVVHHDYRNYFSVIKIKFGAIINLRLW